MRRDREVGKKSETDKNRHTDFCYARSRGKENKKTFFIHQWMGSTSTRDDDGSGDAAANEQWLT